MAIIWKAPVIKVAISNFTNSLRLANFHILLYNLKAINTITQNTE